MRPKRLPTGKAKRSFSPKVSLLTTPGVLISDLMQVSLEEQAQNIKDGAVVAIRNGKSNVVNEHIMLEVDRFGKVTLESDDSVKSTNTSNNISQATWEKKVPKKDN